MFIVPHSLDTTSIDPAGARAGVMVQAFLHRPNLVPYGHRIAMAPQYFLKLKSAEGLRQACPFVERPRGFRILMLQFGALRDPMECCACVFVWRVGGLRVCMTVLGHSS